jgi:2-desacetyl-2-hydroxyethyl bacteriochlorophyllide A dehydrogenase
VKAAVTIEDGRLGIAERAPAPLQARQVRVAVAYCGICGSDIHWRTHFPLGTVMGHEVVGRVIELGDEANGWKAGDRVVIIPTLGCGACPNCREGWTNICTDRRFGIGGPRAAGGYAESVVVFDTMLLALPETLADAAAVLVEPLTVGLHAVNRANVSPDTRVMVIGAGTIGLVTALALRARGFEKLVVVEPNVARRANLTAIGVAAVDSHNADEAVTKALGGQPRAIFECAGYPRAIVDAVRMIAPRGKIICLSAPPEAVALPQWDLISKEAEISSAIFYTRKEFVQAIRLLDSGAVPASAVPVSIFPLSDAPRALDELLAPQTPHMKVLLQP